VRSRREPSSRPATASAARYRSRTCPPIRRVRQSATRRRSRKSTTAMAAQNARANLPARACVGVKHEIGRVGDRQHETCRIGDEGADEKKRQRLDFRFARRCENGRREHNGRCVVGQKERDDGPDGIHQHKQTSRRTAARIHRVSRDPIEQALAARDFRQKHHACQKQIDVDTFADGTQRIARRDQPRRHKNDCAAHGPNRFRPDETAARSRPRSPPATIQISMLAADTCNPAFSPRRRANQVACARRAPAPRSTAPRAFLRRIRKAD
jgi:hypothetical protein